MEEPNPESGVLTMQRELFHDRLRNFIAAACALIPRLLP